MIARLTVRGGIPNVRRRLASGAPLTIVAFGTSITLFGSYLDRLAGALAATSGNPGVRLINAGLRGWTSMWAPFAVGDAVLPHAPDLVILEFAHNDEPLLEGIDGGIDATVAQIRAASPTTEIVVVTLARAGTAIAGPTPAMVLYERLADYYGFPSIDLAAGMEALVAAGRATWPPGSASALTTDGIHHTGLVAELVGEPFAAAFVELVAGSMGPGQPPVPIRDTTFTAARRASAQGFLIGAGWSLGVPNAHDRRTADAYAGMVAVSNAPGAALRFDFDRRGLWLWTMGFGMLEIGGLEEPAFQPVHTPDAWALVPLQRTWTNRPVTVTVVEGTVVVGDVLILGPAAG